MEAPVHTTTGDEDTTVTLPPHFSEPVRTDLIKDAVLAIHQNQRQQYGAKPDAGLRHNTDDRKRRQAYRTFYGRGVSRTPRKIFLRRGIMFHGEGAEAPNTRGGRRAHPPKPEKDWSVNVNRKERRKAIRAALAATADRDTVTQRGHHAPENRSLPLIVSDDFATLSTTQAVTDALHNLGLEEELNRCSDRTVRGGAGTRRNRKYKTRIGPLLVAEDTDTLYPAARNIPGVTVTTVDNMNASMLAPGTDPGRLTVYTETAVQTLEENKLYMS